MQNVTYRWDNLHCNNPFRDPQVGHIAVNVLNHMKQITDGGKK